MTLNLHFALGLNCVFSWSNKSVRNVKSLILGAGVPEDYMVAGAGSFSGRFDLRVLWSYLVMSLNYFK